MAKSRSIPLFAYRPGTSFLHNRFPGIKLLLCALTAPLAFMLPPAGLLILTFSLILLALAAAIRLQSLARILLFVFYYALFIYLMQYAGHSLEKSTLESMIRASVLYLWQLYTVFLAGTIFYETTSSSELRELLEFPARLLQQRCSPAITRRIPEFLKDLPLSFSLMISFIPRIFLIWNSLNTAWESRSAGKKGLLPALRRVLTLVPALITTLLARAADTDRALRNRSI